jgi:transposase
MALNQLIGQNLTKGRINTMETIIIGIDVSQEDIGAFDSHLQKHLYFFNTREGIQELIQHYASFSHKKAIIESNGRHEHLVHQRLDAEGFFVSLLNHYKLHCFARKNKDFPLEGKVTAKILCLYGQHIDAPRNRADVDSAKERKRILACKKGIQEQIDRITERQESGIGLYPFLKAQMEDQIHDLRFQLKEIEKRLS